MLVHEFCGIAVASSISGMGSTDSELKEWAIFDQ